MEVQVVFRSSDAEGLTYFTVFMKKCKYDASILKVTATKDFY